MENRWCKGNKIVAVGHMLLRFYNGICKGGIRWHMASPLFSLMRNCTVIKVDNHVDCEGSGYKEVILTKKNINQKIKCGRRWKMSPEIRQLKAPRRGNEIRGALRRDRMFGGEQHSTVTKIMLPLEPELNGLRPSLTHKHFIEWAAVWCDLPSIRCMLLLLLIALSSFQLSPFFLILKYSTPCLNSDYSVNNERNKPQCPNLGFSDERRRKLKFFQNSGTRSLLSHIMQGSTSFC